MKYNGEMLKDKKHGYGVENLIGILIKYINQMAVCMKDNMNLE